MTMTMEEMILGGLGVITFVAFIVKMLQNRRILKNARIRETDGSGRSPSPDENRALSESLAFSRGSHFWHLIVGGVILIALAWLALKLAG
jgi:hypothetical protein